MRKIDAGQLVIAFGIGPGVVIIFKAHMDLQPHDDLTT